MDKSRSRRRRSFVYLMKQLQGMSEVEVSLVAGIAGKVWRARRAIREAAEAADTYLKEAEQGTLALGAPTEEPQPEGKVPEKLN